MITSTQNTKIKFARSLQKRKEREREGKLCIEGVRLVQDAIEAGFIPETLFYVNTPQDTAEIALLVDRFASVAWEVTLEVMATITDTITPQGIAAVVPLPSLPFPTVPTLLVIADQLRDPGNIGTLLRSAAAAGVDGVIATRGTVDVWSDKVLRSGMGAHFRLPIRNGVGWDEILPRVEDMHVYVATGSGAQAYDKVDWTPPSVLIVGGEADGASHSALQRADTQVQIPMANGVESLNAAVAGSVILFEAARQRRNVMGIAERA